MAKSDTNAEGNPTFSANVRVIIPAFNEQNAIGHVLQEIPGAWVREVIVINNGSTDNTVEQAKKYGATVLDELQKGYGSACLKGIGYLRQSGSPTDIVVFIDADHSDFPSQLPELVKPILDGRAELVIGSRALGKKEKGSMTFAQIFGNWLAATLLRWIYGINFTDLGPFRAVKFDKLLQLGMVDKNYGWTVEMQLKAAKHKLQCMEVPVDYRRRIGKSKVSGTIKGTLMAGYKILWTIFRYI